MPKNKNKVLYICPNGYLGGAERFICNIAQGHLKNQNIDFEILFFTKGDAYELCKSLGVVTHILPMSFRLKDPIALFRAISWIRSLVKNNKYTIIHSTMPYSHIVASLSTIALDIKRIWFQHGPVGGTLDKIANLLPVDQILFNSKYLEQEHLKMPFSNRRSHLHKFINLGVEAGQINQTIKKDLRSKYLDSNEEILLLSAGRICPWKGQLNIIKALSLISKETPNLMSKVKLLIVGDVGRSEDKSYQEELFKSVKENNLEKKIIFTGHINNISDYYHACDIFIHSSNIPEPFGLTVLEAMAAETLVIGSDKGGITDILKSDETGITFNSTGDEPWNELVTVLKRVLNQDDKNIIVFKTMISNAKLNVEKKYSIDYMTEQIEEFLIKL